LFDGIEEIDALDGFAGDAAWLGEVIECSDAMGEIVECGEEGEVTTMAADEVRQNRPLDPVDPVIFFDALRVKLRDEGLVWNKAVHVALALNIEGEKEVLGLWIEQTEGAKFWLNKFWLNKFWLNKFWLNKFWLNKFWLNKFWLKSLPRRRPG
jgi:hypothetical protein